MILVAQVAYIVLRAERYNSISSPFLFERPGVRRSNVAFSAVSSRGNQSYL
ncbi:hypothetical protein Plhal703r1_c38g0135771 [Plasmopara halstedii]